jgi:HrpA-like RNA helicase
MDDGVTEGGVRGQVQTRSWGAECKDCLAERRMREVAETGKSGRRKSHGKPEFEYSAAWADRAFDLGQSRSDRCERHRLAHRRMISALSVPYVDLRVTGEVRDRKAPTGPLGGLGPLPAAHREKESRVDLKDFGFGMSDADILAILEGLRDKRVAVVEAGTGTGKSTFMPFRLMSPPPGATFWATKIGPIVVTEPRRLATINPATFVGETLVFGHDNKTCKVHVGPGFPVGYQVKDDRKWDQACDLIYVTDGTLINWVRNGSLARFSIVIIDEAHERNANIDIILAQLRQKLSEYPHLRVIITSATIDRDFFVDYFGGPSKVFHYGVPAKKNFGYGVPLFVGTTIDAGVIRDGLTLATDKGPMVFSGWSGFGPVPEGYPHDDLAKQTAHYAKLRCVQEIPKEKWVTAMPRALADQVVAIAEGTDFGDILGFLPVETMINDAISLIRGSLKSSKDFDIFPLSRKTDPATTNAATAARSRGQRRRIVIATNIAETSLTVSGVRYVVDSGLICQSEWNPDIASGGLPTGPHSQSGMRQRWGRVGRDAPGWVFPLYTVDQFLSLPKDTPPESTRSNLEDFCIRLISTGLDPATAVLPGNFQSAAYQPDRFAQDAAQTFTKELNRANRMLRGGGLVDPDGDLTALGREIERYSGTASEALAVALGDRLACLPEVALAISVVGGAKLYDGKSAILAVDFDWPPEWRLRAQACHRAIAAGCQDDLDLAVRIAESYQAAEDGAMWCRTWWVNQAALDAALAEVTAVVAKLSAAIKKAEVSRPFQPGLLPRARAAILQAFQFQLYRATGPCDFVSLADDMPATSSADLLVPPAPLVVAFNRSEKPAGPGRMNRKIDHFIAGEVEMIEALIPPAEDSLDDFEVLLRVADVTRSATAAADPLRELRANLPLGSALRLKDVKPEAGLFRVLGVEPLREAFMMPVSSKAPGGADYERSFDPDRDIWGDEADDAAPLDPRAMENNDEAEGQVEALPSLVREAPGVTPASFLARWQYGSAPLVAGQPCLVSEYGIEDGKVVVLLEPFDEDRVSMDPARHDRLALLEEVEVELLGTAEAYTRNFLRFRDPSGLDRIDVPAWKFCSLDRHAISNAAEMKPGERIRAVVIAPESGKRSVSIRPLLRAELQAKTTPKAGKGGKTRSYMPAIVREPPNSYGNLEVALEDMAALYGVEHRLQVKVADLQAKGLAPVLDQRLQAGFEDSFNNASALEAKTPGLASLVERYAISLELRGNRVFPKGPIGLPLARALMALDSGEDWAAQVSAFFDASQGITVSDVLLPITQSRVEVSDLGTYFLAIFRRQFEQRHDVRLHQEAGDLTIRGLDPEAVAAASAYLSAIEACRYFAVQVPKDEVGKVIGKRHDTIRSLQATPGLDWLELAEGVVHIVARDRNAAEAALMRIKALVECVTGTVRVPSDKVRAMIGPKPTRIATISIDTGCKTWRTDVDGQWRIEAPSQEALDRFMIRARQLVPEMALQVTRVVRLTILRDHDPLRRVRVKSPPTQSKVSPPRTPSTQPKAGAGSAATSTSVQPAPEAPREEKAATKPSLWSRITSLLGG